MKLNLANLKKMNINQILQLVEENGSIFISNVDDNNILVQHVYIGDKSIKSLEYSPTEQFEQVLPNVWFREYSLPKVKNLAYFLYKNCKDFPDEEKFEFERDSLYLEDKYAKNILPFLDKNGEVYFNQTYINPIKQKTGEELKREEIILHSKVLNEDREIIIEYPKNYDELKHYKILLLTDGICWKYTMQIGQQLASCKDIEPYIICYVMQKDRNKELPMNKAFAEFISIEVTDYLSNKFNKYKNKDDFVFCGQSFGALTGLYIEMFYPNHIGTIICQSASLWYDKQDEIIKHFEISNINSKLYYSFGNCEKSFISDKGILFKDFIKNNKFCYFNIFAGGHDYISWQEDMIDALKFLK